MVERTPLKAGDWGLIPRLGRSSGAGHGNPLQYSCLKNPMDRGDWKGTVHGVAKSQTRLSDKHLNLRAALQHEVVQAPRSPGPFLSALPGTLPLLAWTKEPKTTFMVWEQPGKAGKEEKFLPLKIKNQKFSSASSYWPEINSEDKQLQRDWRMSIF